MKEAIRRGDNPTVRALANACGCAPSTISRVLNDSVVPREPVMRNLLRELHHRNGLDDLTLKHLRGVHLAVVANQDQPLTATDPAAAGWLVPDSLSPSGHRAMDRHGICDTCGSSIGDTAKHMTWHRSLNDQVSAAAIRLFQELLIRSRDRRGSTSASQPRSM